MDLDIGFYIEYEDLVVQFPINPEKVTISSPGNNKTEEVINLGQINIIKTKQLRSIKWESWLPYEDWFPAIRTKGEFQSAQFYIDLIERIRNDLKPCRLIITGVGISTLATIEDFEITRQNGDYEDTYYSIEFLEYREYFVNKISLSSTENLEDSVTDVGTPVQNISDAPKPTEITIGCSVVINGQVFRDSYGSDGGNTYTNYSAVVNLINKSGSHPYHVTTPAGGALGWMTKDCVVLA